VRASDKRVLFLQSPPSDNSFMRMAEWAASALGGAVLGFLGAVTTFRTKLILNDKALEAHKEKVESELKLHADALAGHRNTITAEAMRAERAFRDSLEAMRRDSDERHEENRAQLRLIKRQQFLTLKALADIARVSGADKRFDDGIWKALAETQEDPN